MADDFTKSVEDGLKLAKRIYFGKDRSVMPPKPVSMDKSSKSYLPTAPMVYAVVFDPAIVDNPDIPSYQPHVYGRCDPAALIPLQMNGIALEVDCYLDTAFVTLTGSWRVHCVMGSRSCDCRLAVPMGEQVCEKEVLSFYFILFFNQNSEFEFIVFFIEFWISLLFLSLSPSLAASLFDIFALRSVFVLLIVLVSKR